MQDLYHIDVTHCTPPARARLHPAPFVKMPQNLVKFSENLHISYERILSTIKSLEQTYKFAHQRKDPIQTSLDIKFKLVFKRNRNCFVYKIEQPILQERYEKLVTQILIMVNIFTKRTDLLICTYNIRSNVFCYHSLRNYNLILTPWHQFKNSNRFYYIPKFFQKYMLQH